MRMWTSLPVHRCLLQPDVILDVVCSDNCQTSFGSVEYAWSLTRVTDAGDVVIYDDLNSISTSGECWGVTSRTQ